jgi:hypothetical protein
MSAREPRRRQSPEAGPAAGPAARCAAIAIAASCEGPVGAPALPRGALRATGAGGASAVPRVYVAPDTRSCLGVAGACACGVGGVGRGDCGAGRPGGGLRRSARTHMQPPYTHAWRRTRTHSTDSAPQPAPAPARAHTQRGTHAPPASSSFSPQLQALRRARKLRAESCVGCV